MTPPVGSDAVAGTSAAPAVPRLLVLTDRTLVPPGSSLVDTVAAAVAGGARGVVLREKDLPRAERAALAAQLAAVLAPVAGVLLVASDPTIPADGVHLAAGDPMPTGDRRPALVGRSCHTVEEVRAAAAAGCDYATLSPVFASRSKPGYGPAVAVGQLGLAQASVPIPVVALGGIGPGEARALHAVGHRHAAVLGAVMEAADPASVVADVLAALDGATLQEAT